LLLELFVGHVFEKQATSNNTALKEKMSRELIKAQRIDIEADEIWINNVKNDSVAGDTYLATTLTFSGAVGATAIVAPVQFYKIGRMVYMNIVDPVYNGNQAAGSIVTNPVPEQFRPAQQESFNAFVINGSQVGGTASIATQMGGGVIVPGGALAFGLRPQNNGTLDNFGGAGSTGSGNGVCRGLICWLGQ
jgi:hypothetical protein